jgi:5-methyltetrahydrofolate--homocysteine methyltransferase
MRNGRLLPDGSPDDVIRGSARDPSRFGEIDADALDEVATPVS